MATPKQEAHWQKTKGLMFITLAIWFFFSTVVFMFAADLNSTSFLGYKLGYYMTAQGSMLAFIILIFWSNNRQEKIDREFGFSDEDREED
jgi:putative solute:sodium symporter small subunit